MDRIALLIPCYNEAQTIETVIKDWKNYVPDAVIYVYDNNSSDGTSKIVKKLSEQYADIYLRHEYKQGKGNVIRRMFREVDAQCYVMVDGDDTYPAKEAHKMINTVLEKQVDMVVGDRLSSTYFTENKRRFHNSGNTITRFFINHIFKSDIKDIMTGCRAFSYQFVKSFPVLSKGFEIETEMTIHAVDRNMLVSNYIINYQDRPEGSESKLNTISDGMKVLKTIFSLYKNYKPFSFFGYFSLFLCIIATILVIPVLVDYFKTGLVERFPTLIVSGFIVIIALLSFFSGVILRTLRKKDRQDYEFRLQVVEEIFKREKV